MTGRLRHRQRAQVAIITPFAIIALIGVLGLVLDIGLLRLIDSELENAADAAALAAAWYDPICPYAPPGDPNYDPRCGDPKRPNGVNMASVVAGEYATTHNSVLATALCSGAPPRVVGVQPGRDQTPNTPAVTVIMQCDAGYLAGSILGLQPARITRWATAAIGNQVLVADSNGRLRRTLGTYLPPGGSVSAPPLIAALVVL